MASRTGNSSRVRMVNTYPNPPDGDSASDVAATADSPIEGSPSFVGAKVWARAPVAVLIVKTDSAAESVVEFLPATYIKRPVESMAIEVAETPDSMESGDSEMGVSAPVPGATAKIAICGVTEEASLEATGAAPET